MKARNFFVLLIIMLLFHSCKKEKVDYSCALLIQGISTDNESKVESAINKLIESLPSQDYTNENFEKLSNRINLECNVSVIWKCFDCVLTLPTQSEIFLVVDSVRGIQKTIDISYTTSNMMRFEDMH